MTEKACVFCRIANGELPAAALYEDDDFCVILDQAPASRGHALILPKAHYADVCELDEAVGAKVFPLAGRIGAAMKHALGCTGFNLVQNNGAVAGQTVNHFHVHVIPRYEDGPAMVAWEQGVVSADEMGRIVEAVKAVL